MDGHPRHGRGAAVIGIRPMYAKLSAFAVSSFIVGVAGALWGFVYLGAWEPAAFSVDQSFRMLFMVIIGGMGSIMGSFFGAAFIVVLPIALEPVALPASGFGS
jgi:branched-chain amino acid transport system permease protein